MQQINLYRPEFQPNREPLRGVQMLWGLGIFAAMLIIVTAISANTNRERALVLEQSRAQLEQLKNQVAQLEQQRPRNNLAELDGQIVRLTQELDRRGQIFNIIANKNLGNNTGFSAHLQALGRQSLDTVSLSVFSLQQGGAYAEFAGKTRAADQVPLYLQRLRSEPVFTQAAFGVLHIAPAKNAAGLFDFSLSKPAADERNESEKKTAVQMLLELNEAVRGAP